MPKLACKYRPRPGRPLETDVGKIKSLDDANRRKLTREIAESLN